MAKGYTLRNDKRGTSDIIMYFGALPLGAIYVAYHAFRSWQERKRMREQVAPSGNSEGWKSLFV